MIGRFLRGIWRAITLLRLALANIIFIAFLLVLLFVLRGGAPTPLPDTAVLRIDPQGRVVDQRSAVQALAILGEREGAGGEVLLRDLIDAVDYASKDPRITSMTLELDGLMYIGQSKALELAEAIARFRAAGKPVLAVGDYFSQDQYRLAVEADQILMHPLGAVAIEGYSSYINYFAEALEKLDVTIHIFRAGEHKSLAEPFQRTSMSDGEKAITRRWLEQLWGRYAADVEARRSLDSGALTALINNYPRELGAAGGDTAALAVRAGLVDRLVERSERDGYIAETLGESDGEGGYEAVGFGRYLRSMRPTALSGDARHIAVVTAQGNMLPGEQDPGAIGGDSLAALLRDAAERDGVRALVLRINTGGGSVFAAEVIREELARIRADGLPVIVSMGAVAASGGYYVAAENDRIYATPATLTGSIGVFAAFPTVDRLLARGGIYTDGVGTTDFAGGLRPDRPLNPLLAATLQQSVDALHSDFIDLVATGRDLAREKVVPIADGRVLSADDALELGLIDAVGGLEDAIEGAAEIAGISVYQVIEVEPPVSPQQLLLERLARLASSQTPPQAAAAVYHWLSPLADSVTLLDSMADPRHLYMRCLSCAN